MTALNTSKRILASLIFAVSADAALAGSKNLFPIDNFAPIEEVEAQLEKLALIDISPDLAYLPESEKKALKEIVKASKFIDRAFRTQVHEDNNLMRFYLSFLKGSPDQAYYEYFKVMQGPWDRVNADVPFINLDEDKVPGANYYPQDMTNEEFEEWIAANPEDEDFIEW